MAIRWRLAGLLLAMSGLVGAATAPCVLACSCMEPLPLAESIDPETAVVLGTVGAEVGGRFPFVVERWFTGPTPSAVLTLEDANQPTGDGGFVIDTCGRTFTPGQHLILVGTMQGNLLATSICSLGAVAESPDGRRLIAEAQALFGSGIVPEPADDPLEPGPSNNGAGISVAPIVIVGLAGAGLVALVVAAVVLLVRQGRRPS